MSQAHGVKKKRPPQLLAPDARSGKSISERARALESACITAMEIIASSPQGRERLVRVDPVPTSTIRLIRQLTANQHGGTAPDRR